MIATAKAANLHEFIDGLADGYDQLLGKNGLHAELYETQFMMVRDENVQ